jgi:hypothetical protein
MQTELNQKLEGVMATCGMKPLSDRWNACRTKAPGSCASDAGMNITTSSGAPAVAESAV